MYRAEAANGEKISTSSARDLLSLLVRANTTADPRERLSDEDVLARKLFELVLPVKCVLNLLVEIPTFLVAGHETTSSLLTWILFRLSIHPEIQAALRAECRANPLPSTQPHGNDPLSAEALNELDHLPLLDAVVRETLRLHSPAGSIRGAVKEDVIPLEKPFVDRSGAVRDSITYVHLMFGLFRNGKLKRDRIAKGDDIFIPIQLVNQAPELWGPDSHEWE